LRRTDQVQLLQRRFLVDPVAVRAAAGLGQQALLLVEADRRRRHAAARTQFTNLHFLLDLQVDLKLGIPHLLAYLEVPMLFSPLVLPNGATIPNRLAKAAMEENMAEAGQLPGPPIHRL
jgi:hypothetical protein